MYSSNNRKARIGDYICVLPTSDMNLLEEALAKTIALLYT